MINFSSRPSLSPLQKSLIAFCSIPLAELKTLSRKKDMRDFVLAEAGNWIAAWIDRILHPLLQGLGKRIRQMAHELHVREEVRLAIFFVSLLFGVGYVVGRVKSVAGF